MTLNSSFTGVVFNYFKPVVYLNLIQQKNSTLRICKESLFTDSFVFYFTKNFYLVSEFNQLIYTFEAAGLIGNVLSKYADSRLGNADQKQPPSALSYENIEGFFNLFYYGSGLALVSFMCEILFEYMKRRKEVRRRQSRSPIMGLSTGAL